MNTYSKVQKTINWGVMMEIKKVPTSKDVALLAGVSQSTVSRAFSTHANLAPETRKKVMDAAQMLNYQPNALASGLVKSNSDIIAVVKGYTTNWMFSDMLSEVVYALQQADKRVIYFEAREDESVDELALKVMRYPIQGLVLMYINLTSELTVYCKSREIPVLQIHRHSISSVANAVLPDNYRAASMAAELFIRNGYKEFIYLSGETNSSTNMERQMGFTKTLQDNGVKKPIVLKGDYTYETASKVIRKHAAEIKKPFAILCANDLMAFATIDVLKYEFNLQVGEDFAVVGFDNLNMCDWPSYELTSFKQPLEQMVKEGIDVLLKNIEDKTLLPVEKRYSMTLIERKSTKGRRNL